MAINANSTRPTLRSRMELQNARTEHLLKQSMLQHAGFSNVFWTEAVNTAVYVLNRAPTSAVKDKTPQEAWSGKKPTVEHFRVFGCDAYAHVSDEKRTKLDSKSAECIFLGYYEGTKSYRLFNPEAKKIVKSRDVKFVESEKLKKMKEQMKLAMIL